MTLSNLTNKEILLIKKFIPKGNCEKIISNLKNKKKYISLSQILFLKTKDWKTR